MSEIKVNSIKGVAASAAAITVNNTDGTCAANITSLNSGQFSNRNKIYNGKMDIDQRNSGSALTLGTNTTTYTVDRFSVQQQGMDEATDMTAQQVDDGPDGFVHSLKITTNTAESSIANDEFVSVYQKMEGQDFQDLAYNTSGAKDITMSFYVKSSITGTFGFTAYRDEPGTDRIVNKTYTINSANTWERKTITIAGDTGRGIQNTNTSVWWNTWHLAAGSNYDSSTSSTWENYATTNWAGGHAQDGVITTAGATWQITGVQLETGSVATDFEHRSYGQELALCQRYYYRWTAGASNRYLWQGQSYSTTSCFGVIKEFPVTMRVAPTSTVSGSFLPFGDDGSTNGHSAFSTIPVDQNTKHSLATGGWDNGSGIGGGGRCVVVRASAATDYIDASAEL